MTSLFEPTRSRQPSPPRVNRLVRGIALLCTGLLAGAFFYGWVTVAPAYQYVPIDVHLRFRTVLMMVNAPVMQTLMLTAIIACLTLAVLSRGWHRTVAAAAATMALTSLLVTRFGNVPINYRIKSWSVYAPPADHLELLQRWDSYHGIRTATAVLAFALLLIALVWVAPAASGTDGSRVKNDLLWSLQLVVAAFLTVSAILKLSGAATTVATFDALGVGQWFRYLVGSLEIAGVVGLLIPRMSGSAALGLAGVMAGATATNVLITGGPVLLTAALLVGLIVLAWGRRSHLIAAVGATRSPRPTVRRASR